MTCPTVQYVDLSSDTATVTFELQEAQFPANDNSGDTPSLTLPSIQTEFTKADLYKTLTYTVQARDSTNNVASCRGQIHVRRKCNPF